ncbi:CASP-like protein 1D2 [Lotus japonicus]|uniref:CASP-like protein 1D2 n=1 Tax=Lotus japonicus TaxID=34305 RepID=UPI0025897A62|nr:CASP-like protein 1D2 [Lotus japonicus]
MSKSDNLTCRELQLICFQHLFNWLPKISNPQTHTLRIYIPSQPSVPCISQLQLASLTKQLLVPFIQVKFTRYLGEDFMASTESDPEHKSSSTPPPPPAGGVDYFKFDVILRFLLLAASVVALAVITSSDQTELVLFQGRPVLQPAKFKYSPAFIYFVVAFSVSGLYALISALASISVIQKPEFKLKFLLHFIFWDALILGITASATGAAGSVAYIGLKGNSHVGWSKVCNVYDKFCRHLGGSIAVALFGSIVTVLLVCLSAYTIHSRVPK